MNEHIPGSPPPPSPEAELLAGNPYASQRQPDLPDLDAGAPLLRSNDEHRLNRKALVFLAGIVALLVVSALWMFHSATADSGEGTRRHVEKVVIPDLPPGPVPAARAADTPIPMASVRPPDAAVELPPLPSAPGATAALPVAPMTASPPQPGFAPPRGMTLLERRMDNLAAAAPQDTALNPYSRALLAGLPPQPAAIQQDPAPAAREDASGAQAIHHPDALLVRGSYIRCVLETRIVTDIPGFTSCVVTEPVYSINGRSLLLPKGSKVSGRYDTDANGPRVAVVWDRITTPNGIDVNMASPGVDNLGGAGHPGAYDAHWASRVGAALMISLVSDLFKYEGEQHGPRTTTVSNGLVTQAPFDSNTARTLERLANQALSRSVNRPATVTINQGTIVNVYVARDVDFSGVLARR